MKTLNKLIITSLRGRRCYALASDSRILQFEFEGEGETEQIGTIYIGKVRNVVKNLNAAFVEYKPGVNGYYSLTSNPCHTFADGRQEARALKSGDEIVVQIAKAAIKTKDAVLTSQLTLTGRYAAVMTREASFGISSKIKDQKWKKEWKSQWAEQERAHEKESESFGVIIRTNAYEAAFSDVWNETEALKQKLCKICADASFRTSYSVLYRPDSFAVSAVRDLRLEGETEVVTDLAEVYEELKESGLFEESTLSLRYYEDSYPLSSLYHLESALDRTLAKNVWLKSGGYLVIEPTEAMTVIDVNTGKNTDKKSPEETYFKTNLEAAAEIAAQLRLRNLSGIIIVDFIDMSDENHKTELLSAFKRYISADPVKTTLVDMTALGLVELTRKKIKRPLHEQLRTRES